MTAAPHRPVDLHLLPEPRVIERAMQSAAMVDAILCDGTKLGRLVRTFRFRAEWIHGARLGTMDNGQGDSYSVAFSEDGLFLRGIVKEVFRAFRTRAIRLAHEVCSTDFSFLPAARAWLSDDAFSRRGEPSTYFAWKLPNQPWSLPATVEKCGEFATQEIPELQVLLGDIDAYLQWAETGIGRSLPRASVKAIFEFTPLTKGLLIDLGAARDLSSISGDARQIGYPPG